MGGSKQSHNYFTTHSVNQRSSTEWDNMLATVLLGIVIMGQIDAAPKAEARADPIVADLAKAIIPQGQIV